MTMKPFKTAPKDGSAFLAGRIDGGEWKWSAIVKWHAPRQYYIEGGFGFARDDRPDPFVSGATHWMPLPEVEEAA